jgi:hypothetical protein
VAVIGIPVSPSWLVPVLRTLLFIRRIREDRRG